MIHEFLKPLIRRAILDLIEDIGGENNDVSLALHLAQLGHRVARSDVATELRWLADKGLVKLEVVSPYLVARSTSDGRDVARGMLTYVDVSPHKTGE